MVHCKQNNSNPLLDCYSVYILGRLHDWMLLCISWSMHWIMWIALGILIPYTSDMVMLKDRNNESSSVSNARCFYYRYLSLIVGRVKIETVDLNQFLMHIVFITETVNLIILGCVWFDIKYFPTLKFY